tara:strand:- start:63 stop:500 length:438 start_codon:yes stop_codon:yes gene_type:complete
MGYTYQTVDISTEAELCIDVDDIVREIDLDDLDISGHVESAVDAHVEGVVATQAEEDALGFLTGLTAGVQALHDRWVKARASLEPATRRAEVAERSNRTVRSLVRRAMEHNDTVLDPAIHDELVTMIESWDREESEASVENEVPC